MSRHQRQSTAPPTGYWTSTQSYVFAIITLVIGLAVGYFVRGSAAPAVDKTGEVVGGRGSSTSQPVDPPTPTKEAVARAVEPLLARLNASPNDPALLKQIGNAYYDHQDYSNAIDYYQRSLKFRPDDVDVRTDMGTAMWYGGDADGALREYDRSLSYRANHPNTLFNIGIVRWHGKKDRQGALEAWNKLLLTNPGYEDRDRVQQLIKEVQQSGN